MRQEDDITLVVLDFQPAQAAGMTGPHRQSTARANPKASLRSRARRRPSFGLGPDQLHRPRNSFRRCARLERDLHLSPSQLGVLLSSFFWTYSVFQIVSGWMVDRFEVNWVLALGVLAWSCATLTTGLVHGFALLLTARLLLGVGESVAYPSYNKIIAKHFRASHRGRANGLISAGWAAGPALGTLVGGLLIAHVGWRLFFVVLGPASLLWLPPG